MKGSVILSLALEVSGVGVILVPDHRFSAISSSKTRIRIGKCACSLALLLAGFLIDYFITHSG